MFQHYALSSYALTCALLSMPGCGQLFSIGDRQPGAQPADACRGYATARQAELKKAGIKGPFERKGDSLKWIEAAARPLWPDSWLA